MADLITVDDVETAIGRPPADQTEEDVWQYHITNISAYINSLVDDSFEEIEDDELARVQADYYGIITLKGGPITEVTSVRNWRSDEETEWDWNGIDEIMNLNCLQVVNVTYSHGWDAVPPDIIALCTDAVLVAINEVDADDLISYQVGDVVEKYASIRTFSENNTEAILDQYRATETTYRLGGRGQYPDYSGSSGIQNV